jgi:AcrR family transcriptional regulator
VPTKKKPTAVKKSTTSRVAKAPVKAYHHGDLHRALLTAAHDELVDVGREALSLRSVARRAGVSHTSAYHYFVDKQALLRALAGEGYARLDEAMRDEMERSDPAPRQRLIAAGLGYFAMAAGSPAVYDLMFNTPLDWCDPTPGAAFQRLLGAVEATRAAIAGCAGDALTDAMMMWEAVHGCAMLSISGQLALAGPDHDVHKRRMLERLTQIYDVRAPAPAGEG